MEAVVDLISWQAVRSKSYKSLDADDFHQVMLSATQGSGQLWRVGKHLRFIGPMLKVMPTDWVIKYGDHVTKIFFRFLKENMEDTERLVAPGESLDTTPSNIVHKIMESKLPTSEKTGNRIFDDVAVIMGAGFENTAGALRVALFHVFDKTDILQQLRAEVATINPRDLKAIERLPYLKAVLMDGLRMSPALGTRLSRIAPDREFLNLVEAHTSGSLDQTRVKDILRLEARYTPLFEHSLRIILDEQLLLIDWSKPLGTGANGKVYTSTSSRGSTPNDDEFPHEFAYLIGDLGEGKRLTPHLNNSSDVDGKQLCVASYGAVEFRAPKVLHGTTRSPSFSSEVFTFGIIACKLCDYM
ncbi:cytochrome P450 [Daldinia bambusicola]|nr:cytochrome P450 [Daldinia bambusicola]